MKLMTSSKRTETAVLTDRFMLLGAAALFSTGGAAVKACSITGWQIAGFRSLVAAVVILLLLPESRRGWSWRVLPVACAYAATLTLYVLANRLTTAANSVFLQSTAPLYLVLLSPLLLREKLSRRDLVFGAAVAIGMVLLVFSSPQAVSTAPNPRLGNVLAVFVGVFWALTLLGLRWLSRDSKHNSKNEGAAAVAVGNLLAFAASLPFLFPIVPGTPTDWIVVVYLGAFQIAGAYVLLTRGVRRVPAFEASLLLLLEPVLNPFWTWLLHGEKPGLLALAGGGIILAATLAKLWAERGAGSGDRDP